MAADYEAASASLAAARSDLDAAERALAVARREKHAADHEQLVADLAECGYGLSSGRIGGSAKFIASHPTLGQVFARDADTLLLRVRSRAVEVAGRKPVPHVVAVHVDRAPVVEREPQRVVRPAA
jgi:hypothetical protein